MGNKELENSDQLRLSAMNFLARREHSRQELCQKLRSRFVNKAEIGQVLDQLEKDDLLSDARFAESFVRSRISRGQGVERIERELQQRGIAEDLVRRAVDDADVDWWALAAATCRRKFGDQPAADFKEKSRRMRFLHYRGFSSDQIKSAVG